MATIDYLWRNPDICKRYSHAVSLHGHTIYSKEGLGFLMDWAEQIPLLHDFLRLQFNRCKEPRADFARAYWAPPLTPRGAYEVEAGQIEKVLGLSAMVSITDHDSIEAPLRLRLLPATRHTPLSLEWTVPFEGAQFHLGIHNLPGSSARRWLSEMLGCAAGINTECLENLLAELNKINEVLIVLNHPLWDLCAVGKETHIRMLERFLCRYNRFLHAFELGGLRSWEENQGVVDLANAWNQVLLSGGDRHGLESSAVLNLTNAKSFDEFVCEIRYDRLSHLVFMPQYRQSLKLRILNTAKDATSYIAGHPLGPRWEDRAFHPDAAGEHRSLARLWRRTPKYLQIAVGLLQAMEFMPFKALGRFITLPSKNEFRLRPLGEDGDAA